MNLVGLPLPRPFAPADATSFAPVRSTPHRRSRLWELSGSFHCSVIGTCLTTGELRQTMSKLLQRDVSAFSDHELHSQAVCLCGQQNPAAKLLQKALDRRHQPTINRFGRLQGEAAVMAAWAEALKAGDIPGAYWAVLTHPDTGPVGLRRAFGDVHMLSHLVGAANRADIRRLTALEAENAELAAKVERQQRRLLDMTAERDALRRQLATLALEAPPRDEAASATLVGMRTLVTELQNRLAGETARREHLERRVAELDAAGRESAERARDAAALAEALRREIALLDPGEEEDGASAAPPPLPAHTVLYVGGRPASTHRIRQVLAAAGGRLLTHDGGRDEHISLLPGLIGQAAHVVFPVDCVSHDAMLTIKRLCRQSGTPWSPLRSTGLAPFLAAIAPDAHICLPETREAAS